MTVQPILTANWQEPTEPELTVARRVRRNFRLLARNRLAIVGLALSVLFALVGLAGLLIWGIESLHELYLDQNLNNTLRPPFSGGNLLGTDQFGRDLLVRIVTGVGVSLAVAAGVTAVTLIAGMVIGTVAAYYGGWVDRIVSGVMDVTWGFPVILVAVVLSGVFDPGIKIVLITLCAILWAGFARIIRGQVLSLREQDFIKAARAMGVPDWKIMLRHFAPNLIAPTIVMGSYYIPLVIIAEGALSFIGLGAQQPTPSLGLMIADGRQFLQTHHWAVTMPSLFLVLIAVGFNTLGDGLRDVLDPRLRSVR